MNRIITIGAIALSLATSGAFIDINKAHAATPLKLIVDGQAALSPLQPFHSGGILYVPARVLLEYYPAELQWDNKLKKLTLTDTSSHHVLSPGSSSIQVQYTQTEGGYEERLEGPVLLKEGHVYIPADTVNHVTGGEAKLDASGHSVSITPGSVSTTVRIPKEPLAVAQENAKVKLYTALKDGDTYKGFILEVNGKKHTFNWEAPRDSRYTPELHYVDVDQDGKREAVVILMMGTGTGIALQEVHVVKPEQWKEIAVPAADKAAAAVVASKITLEHDDVLVKLDIKGTAKSSTTLRLPGRAGDGDGDYFGDHAGIGAVTHYQVESGKLKADTNVTVGNLESLGTLMLTYKSGSAGMVLDTIRFEPHDTTEQYVEDNTL